MRALIDLLFPPSCPACGARGSRWLCGACTEATGWIAACCDRCGRPAATPVSDCGDCRPLRPAFRRARAAALYAGPARAALMAFKLGGERRSARWLAEAMARATAPLEADVVTAVPATARAEAARGFNPADELARHVARLLGLPRTRLLVKVRETADQAGLGRGDRKRNLAGAFAARRLAAAPGRVLLVDDVLTTGATAHACAAALREAGVGMVDVLTFARAANV